jgi:hypothetical protein
MVTEILEGLGSKLLHNISNCLPINMLSYPRLLAFFIITTMKTANYTYMPTVWDQAKVGS